MVLNIDFLLALYAISTLINYNILLKKFVLFIALIKAYLLVNPLL